MNLQMKFIDPRIDFAFKKIFGGEDTKDILISFLESLMKLKGDKRIKEIQILDPYQAPKIKGMKFSVLDIKCIDQSGVHYVVEMQVAKVRAFLKRIQYNAAKAYVNQISESQNYPKLNQVIAITITDFTLFETFSHYVSLHETKEQITGENLLKDIVYYFIELSKFQKSWDDLDNLLDKWIFFIKETGKLKDVPETLDEEPFRHAFEKARVANMNQKEFDLYENSGMAIADTRGAVELALEEGDTKGQLKRSITLLLLLLEKKFGDLSEQVRDKVLEADQAHLEKWTLKILETDTLDNVFMSGHS